MSKSALKIIILLILTLSSGYIIKNGYICEPQTPKIDQAFFEALNQIDSNRKFVFIL